MINETALTFDDVLIEPKFSSLGSRKEVSLSVELGEGIGELTIPVISANMETITGPYMTKAMRYAGGMGILHRFMTIQENIEAWVNSHPESGVSVGISDGEKERAQALVDAGAYVICVDVAHGAQQAVVDQVKWLRSKFGNEIYIIVGNFATSRSINDFTNRLTFKEQPDAYKVGIGPGSVCTTRVKTGVGVPQFSAILDCAKNTNRIIIADGGMKTPGDIAKALGAGAKAVMLGGMLAGTQETPGEVINDGGDHSYIDPVHGSVVWDIGPATCFKIYKGSASGGFGNGWKTSEGVEIKIPYKGPVVPILKDIEGGLRSAFTYVGASNLTEFQNKVEFIKVSPSTKIENGAHGTNQS